MQLNNLISSGKKRKTIGRGGSRGGTSGKGHKGQKARSGGFVRLGFEGGQTPLYRRLPKRGFNNYEFKTEYQIINLGQLESAYVAGETVTRLSLEEKGLVKRDNTRVTFVKILGAGQLSKKLIIEADACSKSAQEAISKLGGEVRITKE